MMRLTASAIIEHVVGESLLHVLDADRRPLGEQSSTSAYVEAGIDERPCPFQDRRRLANKPINMAALRQVQREWDAILDTIARITRAASPARDMLTGGQVAHVNAAMQFSPLVWLATHPGAIPAPLAATFKLSIGFIRTLPMINLSMDEIADTPLLEVLSPEEFFSVLDQHEWLTGQAQVCAGARRSIMSIYEAMASRDERDRGQLERAHVEAIAHATNIAPACHELDMLVATTTGLARQIITQGAASDLPGYGEAPRDIDFSTWPLSARLLEQGRARSIELVRSTPSLTPDLTQRAFSSADRPAWLGAFNAPTILDATDRRGFEALDELLLAHARPLVSEVSTALGGERITHLTSEDFLPVCQDLMIS